MSRQLTARSASRMAWAVLLAAAILFLWQLGGHDLWAPDEPYFAEGAREMVVDGEWIVPHVNGVVTPDKPPLFFWLIALLSLPLGEVTAWTARLPSVLAALGSVALILRLGRRLYGPRTAILAGTVLATLFMFWEKARWSQIDSLLCFLIWVALSAFEAFRAGDADGRRAGLLFWLAAALAVLAKGPVGLLLPVGIAVTVLVVDRQPGRLRRFAPLSGPALFALVVGAWIAATELIGPPEYSVLGALEDHFVSRGIQGLHHKQPFWYFLETLPLSLMPWSALVPGALVLAWRRRSPADRFVLSAALFVVIFFSISTEKRELYALPALPAFALMIAALVAVVCGWPEPAGESPAETSAESSPRLSQRWVTIGQGILGGLLTVVGLALPFAAPRLAEIPSLPVYTLAVILLLSGAATLAFALRGKLLASALAPAAGFAAAYLLLASAIYPALEGRKSARPFAQRIAAVTAASRAAGMPVVAYSLSNLPEPFAFYSNGVYTVETGDPVQLGEHLERSERVYAVVDGDRLEALSPSLLARLYVVDETVLARKRVLLLTNRPYPGARPLVVTETPIGSKPELPAAAEQP